MQGKGREHGQEKETEREERGRQEAEGKEDGKTDRENTCKAPAGLSTRADLHFAAEQNSLNWGNICLVLQPTLPLFYAMCRGGCRAGNLKKKKPCVCE